MVYLIGAGPGDPGLITVRGLACLSIADVVLYDHLVHPRLLAHAPTDAERIDVGTASPQEMAQEAICYLLAEKAREGKTVARLKWGDPFVFDRGGEEALFLHEQGVPFEVVPGIPAAIGIPGYAGVPLTYPGGGDTVTLVRGHEDESQTAPQIDWASLAKLKGTIVCYAGTRQLPAILESLRLARTAQERTGRGDLRGHAAGTAHRGRHAWRAHRGHESGAPTPSGDSRRWTRRRAAPAPALVRQSPAVRTSRRRDAAEGRRPGSLRSSRGGWRRGHRGADDPHLAARELGAARQGRRADRQLSAGSCSRA